MSCTSMLVYVVHTIHVLYSLIYKRYINIPFVWWNFMPMYVVGWLFFFFSYILFCLFCLTYLVAFCACFIYQRHQRRHDGCSFKYTFFSTCCMCMCVWMKRPNKNKTVEVKQKIWQKQTSTNRNDNNYSRFIVSAVRATCKRNFGNYLLCANWCSLFHAAAWDIVSFASK